jgi:hypothetical protein
MRRYAHCWQAVGKQPSIVAVVIGASWDVGCCEARDGGRNMEFPRRDQGSFERGLQQVAVRRANFDCDVHLHVYCWESCDTIRIRDGRRREAN